MSHPTWVRGLKFLFNPVRERGYIVAPHVGAWIEIYYSPVMPIAQRVAPHVGAWIEIATSLGVATLPLSHPTWVRGLK